MQRSAIGVLLAGLGMAVLGACVPTTGNEPAKSGDPTLLRATVDDLPLGQGDAETAPQDNVGAEAQAEAAPEPPADLAPAQPRGLAGVLAALGLSGDAAPAPGQPDLPPDDPPNPDPDPDADADAAVTAADTPAAEPAAEPTPPQPPPPPATVPEAINAARAARGLDPLARDHLLDVAAGRHLRDMLITGFYGHRSSDGATLPDRVNAVGFCFRRLVENLARGDDRPERVIRQWTVDSAEDRRNLMIPEADSFGLAGSQETWVLVIAQRC